MPPSSPTTAGLPVACSCCTPGRCPINPYDGHTLRDVIDRTETLTGCPIERAYVDKGTAATTHKIPVVSSSSARSAAVLGVIKRELRRRSAIEPIIGHLKAEGHLRALPPQGPRRRRHQRRPLRRRPRLPPHPRLAQRIIVPVPVPAMTHARQSSPTQSGFLTDDTFRRRRLAAVAVSGRVAHPCGRNGVLFIVRPAEYGSRLRDGQISVALSTSAAACHDRPRFATDLRD